MEKKGMLHSMNQPTKSSSSSSFSMGTIIGIIVVALLLGTVGGFAMTKFGGGSMSMTAKPEGKAGEITNNGNSAGIKDTKTFNDTAEGVLKEGGFEGEGSYHIERKPGQPDQNAYLTSTAVDLSKFVGKKVKVWGQTFQGEKAGWLMDVGYIEVQQ